jgi:hypothetical protein
MFLNVAPQAAGVATRPITLLGVIEVSTRNVQGITHELVSPGGTRFLLRPFPDQARELARRVATRELTVITGRTEGTQHQGIPVVIPDTIESPSTRLPGVPGIGFGLAGMPGLGVPTGLAGIPGVGGFPTPFGVPPGLGFPGAGMFFPPGFGPFGIA